MLVHCIFFGDVTFGPPFYNLDVVLCSGQSGANKSVSSLRRDIYFLLYFLAVCIFYIFKYFIGAKLKCNLNLCDITRASLLGNGSKRGT
jgi:hypothetical protein